MFYLFIKLHSWWRWARDLFAYLMFHFGYLFHGSLKEVVSNYSKDGEEV